MDVDRTVPKNVTTPVTLNNETGEVIVKKASGKIKVRTGQTVEDYLDQRSQFWQTDSKECTNLNIGWMSENFDIDALLSSIDTLKSSKHKRQRITDYLAWLFYHNNNNNREFSQLITDKIIPVFNEINTELKGKIKKEVTLLERLSKLNTDANINNINTKTRGDPEAMSI